MNVRVLTGGLAVMVMLGLSMQPVWADREQGYSKGHGGGYSSGHGMRSHHASTGHLLRGLLGSQKEMGLTEDQVSKLKKIQLDLDKTRIKMEADILIAERELQSLIDDEKSDLGAIEAKLKESEMMEVGLRMAAIKVRRDVMALLTPEQSARIKAVHERRMMERKSEMGESKGPGAPKAEPKKGAEKKGGEKK